MIKKCRFFCLNCDLKDGHFEGKTPSEIFNKGGSGKSSPRIEARIKLLEAENKFLKKLEVLEKQAKQNKRGRPQSASSSLKVMSVNTN